MNVNRYHWSELKDETRHTLLFRAETDIQEVQSSVLDIVNYVKSDGDKALTELNTQYDGALPGCPFPYRNPISLKQIHCYQRN